MAKDTPLSEDEKIRRKALARWENEGGADSCGPQVPGVGTDCDEDGDAAATEGEASPSRLIDARIAALGDWRGETLARVRALIKAADGQVVEAVKWRKPSSPMGVPVWEHAGILCTGETYKDKVKLTFARGAALEDPSGLFNSSLEGSTRRAIDISEGEAIDGEALKALVRAAVAENLARRA